MKIHFIISRLKGGGAERVLVLLAEAFAQKTNYDISIITLNRGKDFYTIPDSIKRLSMDKGNIPNHTIKGIYNLSKFYFHKNNRPDLIISFITLTNFITILVAKLYKIKIIVEEHNSHLRAMENRAFLTKLTKQYLYRHADTLTVLTKFDVDYYKNFGAKVVVMPNPCSFNPLEKNTIKRDKVILAVGNLDRYNHKGFDNLIDLIAPLLKSNPDWTLKIAGSGSKGLKLLSEMTEERNLSNKIIFTGFVSNISELMKSSSIFVLSSRYEGLPMVLLEAMSQGMACIAYDCKTGPSDIVYHNENGLLIDDQNKEDMQINLQKLISDSHLRDTLAKNGIKSLNVYHIDSVVKQYEIVFDKIGVPS